MNKENAVVLSGDLEFISLPEVVQLLGGNGSTGVLRLKEPGGGTGTVHIREGNPIDAAIGPLSGIEALYALIAWKQGSFDFTPGSVRRKDTIRRNRMEVILDGLRIMDEGRAQDQAAPHPPHAIDAQGGLPLIKGPISGYVYVVDHEEFEDGQRIITEGKFGQWLWVILDGVVEITRNTPHGPLGVMRLGEGGIVGNIAGFSLGKNARESTARAIGKVHLGVLDYQRLSGEFALLPPDLRRLITGLDMRLRQLTDRVVEYHSRATRPEAFTKGKQSIMEQGAKAKGLFRISRGEVCIARQDKKRMCPLVTLGPGDFYGRIPFIHMGHEPDGAAVLAGKELKSEAIDTDLLARDFQELSVMFKIMAEHAAACISFVTNRAVELCRPRVTEKGDPDQ
jgi:CRP-like cAMP-binding protein